MNQQTCIHTCIHIERHIQTSTSPNARDLISRSTYVESIFTCIHLDRCRERPVQTAVILSPEVTRRRLFLSLTRWNSTLFLPSTLKPKGNCSINSGGLCRVATYSVRHLITWKSVCCGMGFIPEMCTCIFRCADFEKYCGKWYFKNLHQSWDSRISRRTATLRSISLERTPSYLYH